MSVSISLYNKRLHIRVCSTIKLMIHIGCLFPRPPVISNESLKFRPIPTQHTHRHSYWAAHTHTSHLQIPLSHCHINFLSLLSLPWQFFPPNHTHFPPYFHLLPRYIPPYLPPPPHPPTPPTHHRFASAGQRGGRREGVRINRLFTLPCGPARNRWRLQIKL